MKGIIGQEVVHILNFDTYCSIGRLYLSIHSPSNVVWWSHFPLSIRIFTVFWVVGFFSIALITSSIEHFSYIYMLIAFHCKLHTHIICLCCNLLQHWSFWYEDFLCDTIFFPVWGFFCFLVFLVFLVLFSHFTLYCTQYFILLYDEI